MTVKQQEGKIMSNTTTRTRKAAAATKTATANITAARKAATKAPAKKTTAKKAPAHVQKQAKEVKEMAPAGPDKPKSEQTFEERDWTYLAEKDPSEQHILLAKEINRRAELDEPIDAKHVQAVLAMFPHFQKSDTNKNRSQYRPLAEEIVHQRSVHMTLAHKEAREIMDNLSNVMGQNAKPRTTPVAKKTAAKAPAKKAAASTRKASEAKPVAKKAPAKRTARKTTTATDAF